MTGFDPATQALAIAQQNAISLGLSLKTVEARDDTFDCGESRWDLILLSYAGCGAENVPRIVRALRPGGLLVVEAFHTDAAREFKIGGSPCGPGQLPHMFQGLRRGAGGDGTNARRQKTGDLFVPIQWVAGARYPLNLEFSWTGA